MSSCENWGDALESLGVPIWTGSCFEPDFNSRTPPLIELSHSLAVVLKIVQANLLFVAGDFFCMNSLMLLLKFVFLQICSLPGPIIEKHLVHIFIVLTGEICVLGGAPFAFEQFFSCLILSCNFNPEIPHSKQEQFSTEILLVLGGRGTNSS